MGFQMSNLLCNKSAEDKLLSLWWFFILFIIAGGILIGVAIFYSAEINVNPVEADILSSKLSECITPSGIFNYNFLSSDVDIFKECNLNKKVFGRGSSFYFNVSIYNETSLEREFIEGDHSFEADCRIGGGLIAKNFPKCSKKNIGGIDYLNKTLNVAILVGSNQKGGRISISK
jgi:hypothetical protein